jgi:hypothetical protein
MHQSWRWAKTTSTYLCFPQPVCLTCVSCNLCAYMPDLATLNRVLLNKAHIPATLTLLAPPSLPKTPAPPAGPSSVHMPPTPRP